MEQTFTVFRERDAYWVKLDRDGTEHGPFPSAEEAKRSASEITYQTELVDAALSEREPDFLP